MPTLREFPPTVLPTFAGIPLDGGRVQSITINPAMPDSVYVANEFGGFWFSSDRGGHWSRIDSLKTVWGIDIACAPTASISSPRSSATPPS